MKDPHEKLSEEVRPGERARTALSAGLLAKVGRCGCGSTRVRVHPLEMDAAKRYTCGDCGAPWPIDFPGQR